MKLINDKGKYSYETKVLLRNGGTITGNFKAEIFNIEAVAEEWVKRFIIKDKSEWLEFETKEKGMLFIAKKEIQSIQINFKN